jgi:hypothetical protein
MALKSSGIRCSSLYAGITMLQVVSLGVVIMWRVGINSLTDIPDVLFKIVDDLPGFRQPVRQVSLQYFLRGLLQ